jgi:hypothetical protein
MSWAHLTTVMTENVATPGFDPLHFCFVVSPHPIDFLMLFCLRLHLLAFFLSCIASGVVRGTQKRAFGCGGRQRSL